MRRLVVMLVVMLVAGLAGAAAPPLAAPQRVPVIALAAAPTVDGNLDDWPAQAWVRVPIAPADDTTEEKAVGKIEVELAAGIAGDSFYLAARWPDEREDRDYRPWRWNGQSYKRGEERDDMFAVRFHLDGDYDRCMISENTYRVDVWLWSAGRSDGAGLAEDASHALTTALTESAAEYKTAKGSTVYIRKIKDEGVQPYEQARAPKQLGAERLSSIRLTERPSASAADVRAKGVWQGGRWSVEMARKRDTGQTDDVVLAARPSVEGAVAVFNRSHSDNKSVSDTLLFEFPPP